MSLLLNVATALLAVGGAALTLVALLAWRRSGQGRLALLGVGFACFAAAGAWTAVGLFTGADSLDLLTAHTLLAASGLFVIYLAAVRK